MSLLQQSTDWQSGTIFSHYLDRGRVVHTSDGYMVECKQHLQRIGVRNTYIGASQDKILDLIGEAFDQCTGCIDEKEWGKSRWPSGAEL